jgi:hypothetical protein
MPHARASAAFGSPAATRRRRSATCIAVSARLRPR